MKRLFIAKVEFYKQIRFRKQQNLEVDIDIKSSWDDIFLKTRKLKTDANPWFGKFVRPYISLTIYFQIMFFGRFSSSFDACLIDTIMYMFLRY